MPSKGFDTVGVVTDAVVPELGGGVTGARNEAIVINIDTHNIACVVSKYAQCRPRLHVPQDAVGVTRGSDDLIVRAGQEAATGQVAIMLLQSGVWIL